MSDKDPREWPRYTLAQASAYLDVPKTTLHQWCRGRDVHLPNGAIRPYRALIDIEHYDAKKPSLSYFNLVELHVLSSTRYREKIALQRIREAIDYTAKKYPSRHPLITRQFYHDGKDLFIRAIEEGSPEEAINASRRGQVAIREVVDLYLKRIVFGMDGLPEKFFPVRRNDVEHTLFAIQPNLSGGHPVVDGTGVRVSVILGRFNGGDSVDELAEDYGIDSSVIKKAIEYAEAA